MATQVSAISPKIVKYRLHGNHGIFLEVRLFQEEHSINFSIIDEYSKFT